MNQAEFEHSPSHWQAPLLVTFGWSLFLIAILYGGMEFRFPVISHLTDSSLKLFALGATLSAVGATRCIRHRLPFFSLAGLLAALTLVYLSDVPQRHDSFARGTTLPLEATGAALLALLLRRNSSTRLWEGLATAFAAAAFILLLRVGGGAWLSSDDHPAFLYRLTQLRDVFPFIPFYNPEWNGGVDAREFFASGALIPFFLFAPLLYSLPIERVYSILVGILLFALTPGSVYLAIRTIVGSRRASALGAILSLTASLLWYRYALSYGTLGFVASVALLPLLLALGVRALTPSLPWSRWHSIAFSLLGLLTLLWPLALLFCLPLLLSLALGWRTLRSRAGLLPALGIAALLYVVWAVLFVQSSHLGSFLGTQLLGHHPSHKLELSQLTLPVQDAARNRGTQTLSSTQTDAHAGFRAYMESSSPLLLAAMLLGLMLLPSGSRRVVVGTLTWLLFLGIAGTSFAGTLELHRMLIVLLLVGCVPAALSIEKLLSEPPTRAGAVATVFCIALLLLVPRHLQRLLQRQTSEVFHFAQHPLPELVRAIKEFGGRGRTLFAGFILHDLSYGHVAPLPYLTGKPIIASRYQHDVWRYTDVIPEWYRDRKTEGVESFLDLYNVSAVVTHEPFWRKWFLKHKKRYSPVWQQGSFTLFERKQFPDSYVLRGDGAVTETGRAFVKLLARSPEMILRYNFFPFLDASPCRISPFKAGHGVVFVRLSACPIDTEITLASRNPLHRFAE